jgi:hypothetical protein
MEMVTIILEHFFGAEITIQMEDEVASDQDRTALVRAGYDLIFMPLSLHNYGALKIAELVHQLDSSSRIVLRSGTRAPRDVLLNLFDAFVGEFVTGRELKETIERILSKPPRRYSTSAEIESAIIGILATASCFKKGRLGPSSHHSDPSTLDDYRSSYSDPDYQYKDRIYPEEWERRSGCVIPPIKVFISYSHQDEPLRRQLEDHLALLKRQGGINIWHDRRISPGEEWKGKIDRELAEAHIILLVVTSSFLASDYCYDVEMKVALERSDSHDAFVVPIIGKACDWHTAPFAKLQSLPKDGQPVTSWPNTDEAWADVASGIRRLASRFKPAP